jgi:hypothetical protein
LAFVFAVPSDEQMRAEAASLGFVSVAADHGKAAALPPKIKDATPPATPPEEAK